MKPIKIPKQTSHTPTRQYHQPFSCPTLMSFSLMKITHQIETLFKSLMISHVSIMTTYVSKIFFLLFKMKFLISQVPESNLIQTYYICSQHSHLSKNLLLVSMPIKETISTLYHSHLNHGKPTTCLHSSFISIP